jgi:hypothetical protein
MERIHTEYDPKGSHKEVFMNKYAILTFVAATVAAGFLSGCVVTGTTYVRAGPRPYYYGRREVIVEPRPAVVFAPVPPPAVVVAPAPGIVVVHRPLPAPLVERIPIAPGPDYVWIGGYYDAFGDDWVWVPGGYVLRPRPGVVWVAPHYEQHGGEFHYSRGHWR